MPVLYSHPVSQHCRRILALIDEAGIAMDIRHVALEAGAHVSPDYLAINPNHQVPTLIDGDVKIHESNAILRYLADKHGLTGAVPTIAALTVASIVTHLALADAAPEHANISAWIKRVCRIPGFARTLPMATAAT